MLIGQVMCVLIQDWRIGTRTLHHNDIVLETNGRFICRNHCRFRSYEIRCLLSYDSYEELHRK